MRAKVDFYNSATSLGSATTAPYAFTWTNVPAGSHSLTAVATDNNNAKTTSAAQLVNVIPAGTSQVFYIYSDQINTAKEITDAAGAKVWEGGTDPFGADLPNENPAGKGKFVYNARFPGQYYDLETAALQLLS